MCLGVFCYVCSRKQEIDSAQMCLFSYCITVTQIEQQTVGNINVFCSFIWCALTEVIHFIRLSVVNIWAVLPHFLIAMHTARARVCVCVCVRERGLKVMMTVTLLMTCRSLYSMLSAFWYQSNTKLLYQVDEFADSLQITQNSVCAGTKPNQKEVWGIL
jgi:hypothetical protein